MIFKVTVVLCILSAIAYIEAFENVEPILTGESAKLETSPEFERSKRHQPFHPVASLLGEPLNRVAQSGADPISHVYNGAAEIARNFPLRQRRHLQPVFSLLGDHFNRVAKAFDGLAGRDSSNSNSNSNTNSNSDSDSNSSSRS
ncbi:uncharacterized protein [Battus philenor]|uniref:uncharacterized protein n=1 Tax=Battus philenor TaxID=42288 RepID=UPI0035D0C41D